MVYLMVFSKKSYGMLHDLMVKNCKSYGYYFFNVGKYGFRTHIDDRLLRLVLDWLDKPGLHKYEIIQGAVTHPVPDFS
jgi:hypothetical protein